MVYYEINILAVMGESLLKLRFVIDFQIRVYDFNLQDIKTYS